MLSYLNVKTNGVRGKVDQMDKVSIYTVKYSILINSSPVGFFSPQKGIRQRDPLSPFFLSSQWKGSAECLPKQRACSGLKGLHINMSKTITYPVNDAQNQDSLADILCCSSGTLPTPHLGFSLGAKYRSVKVWMVS